MSKLYPHIADSIDRNIFEIAKTSGDVANVLAVLRTLGEVKPDDFGGNNAVMYMGYAAMPQTGLTVGRFVICLAMDRDGVITLKASTLTSVNLYVEIPWMDVIDRFDGPQRLVKSLNRAVGYLYREQVEWVQ